MAEKPSFLSSVASGIKGWAKGLLVGGMLGAASGAVIGAIVGVATAGFAAPALAIIGTGMIMGASILGGAGAMAGTMTEVVRSRETAPAADDVLNVAKISYAKGVSDGHQLAQEQGTKWQDQEKARAGARSASQLVH